MAEGSQAAAETALAKTIARYRRGDLLCPDVAPRQRRGPSGTERVGQHQVGLDWLLFYRHR